MKVTVTLYLFLLVFISTDLSKDELKQIINFVLVDN